MGNTLTEQGRLDEAEASYRRAIALKPDFTEAYSNLGNTLKEKGRLGEAISAYVFAINLTADNAYLYANFGAALKGARFEEADRGLYPILTSLLIGGDFVRPSSVVSAILSLLKRDTLIKDLLSDSEIFSEIEEVGRAIKTLAQYPLLDQIMRICPLPDLELENLFVSFRRVLLVGLGRTEASAEIIYFLSTLSLHCFNNEYVYSETAEETELISLLEEAIAASIEQGSQPTVTATLCFATYRPLYRYDWSQKLHVLDQLSEVKARLIEEPSAERLIAQDIPVLGTVDDAVSRKVREQYEENPYPRWVQLAIPQKAKPVAKVCNELKLQLACEDIKNISSPSILIAGCGTGQHSIETASRFESSRVTAVDLSLASLAYAQRKTNELGITNIKYFQGDILKLDQQEQQFDLIESGVVLHHMDDPMAGWSILADLLKTGGLMKIGLYSEFARGHIVQTREDISLRGIATTEAEIRRFRQYLIDSRDEHHLKVRSALDFFSLSEVRDLLFHVQEHHFTLPKIQKCLDKLGLKFCGFEDADNVREFQSLFGREADTCDLSLWHQFEDIERSAFAGMYQFWCQKL